MGSVCADEDDDALVAMYRKGDTGALARLVDRYRIKLFAFILGMAGRTDDADDIFQEVWFRAIDKIEKYKDKNFLAWLTRFAHNLIIDRWRGRKDCVSFDATVEEGGSDFSDRLAGSAATPDREAESSDAMKCISDAVAALPPEQREVFLMRMKEDLSFKEIADIQGVSISTSLARMQYGLAKLRSLLGDEHGPERRQNNEL